METQEQTQPLTGNDFILIQMNEVERSLQSLLKAIANFGTPEQAAFVSEMWIATVDMREAQEEYLAVKREL